MQESIQNNLIQVLSGKFPRITFGSKKVRGKQTVNVTAFLEKAPVFEDLDALTNAVEHHYSALDYSCSYSGATAVQIHLLAKKGEGFISCNALLLAAREIRLEISW